VPTPDWELSTRDCLTSVASGKLLLGLASTVTLGSGSLCVAMTVSSRYIIPAFRRHVTVGIYLYVYVFMNICMDASM
jgi:hypothetical protein